MRYALAALASAVLLLALPITAGAVVVQNPEIEKYLGHPGEVPPPNNPTPSAPSSPSSQPEPHEAMSELTEVHCVVPSLKRSSLKAAQSKLRAAHCKPGKVTKPPHHHGRLVVVSQSPRAGEQRTEGTAVAIKLGIARSSHRHA